MTEQQSFDSWAVVELFGHQKIIGRVGERALAGTTFLQVEVPESAKSAAYTRLFGAGAIYGITPCTEEQAKALLSERWSGVSHPVFAAKQLPPATLVHEHAGGPGEGGDDFELEDER